MSDIRFTDLSFFNGKDLTGWFGAKDHWRVENGEIVGAFPAGVEPTDTCTASVTRLTPEALGRVKPDDFNDMIIRCTGERVKVIVNGVVAVDEERSKFQPKGVIAWQLGTTTEELRIRNIRFSECSPPIKP